MTRPRTTRLILARHGEVDERWRGTIYGRLDVELSDRGREQSERIASSLGHVDLDHVVSSGLQRAEAAAAALRASRPELGRTDDPRFLELDRGDWAGRTLDDIRAADPEGFAEWERLRGAVRAPNGESPADVARRTVPAFQDWATRAAGGAVAIVAHLWVVRSAAAFALGLPMARCARIGCPPGGIIELDWPVEPAGGAPRLIRLGA